MHLAQAISGEESVQVAAASPLLNLQKKKKNNWLQVQEDITFQVTFSSLRMWTPFLVEESTQSYI